MASKGVSLTLATSSVKSPNAPSLPSHAVTRTLIEPTSALAGVPLKVWVPESKLSQVGSAAPEASVAV